MDRKINDNLQKLINVIDFCYKAPTSMIDKEAAFNEIMVAYKNYLRDTGIQEINESEKKCE